MTTQTAKSMRALRRTGPFLLVSLVAQVLYFAFWFTGWEFGDTDSYVYAWYGIKGGGGLSVFRPPGYPLFMGFVSVFTKGHLLECACLLQYAVFLAAVVAMDALMRRMRIGGWWRTGGLLVLVLFPETVVYNFKAVPDSLSLTMGIFWMCALYGVWRKGGIWRYAMLTALMLAMVMTKPALAMVLVGAAVASLVALLMRRWRKGAGLFAAMLLPAAAIVGYSGYVESREGVFTPSTVSVDNEFLMARRMGISRPDLMSEPMREAVGRAPAYAEASGNDTAWSEHHELRSGCTWREMQDYNEALRREYPGLRLKMAASSLRRSLLPEYAVQDILMYLLLIAGLGMTAVEAACGSRMRPEGEAAGCRFVRIASWSYGAAIVALCIFMADLEYPRLMLPALAPLLLAALTAKSRG